MWRVLVYAEVKEESNHVSLKFDFLQHESVFGEISVKNGALNDCPLNPREKKTI
jgi:hypothetical protein